MAWDFKGEEGNSHGDEKANFGKKKKKKILLGLQQTMGNRMDSDLQGFSHHTQATFSADISGDGSIPGTGPLSKFFWTAKEEGQSFFLSLWGFNSHPRETHFVVANFALLPKKQAFLFQGDVTLVRLACCLAAKSCLTLL